MSQIIGKGFLPTRSSLRIRPWRAWWPNAERNLRSDTYDWIIPERALEFACSFLGLNNIPYFFDEPGYATTYYFSGLFAEVSVDANIIMPAVDFIIWHELTHCLQHQRRGLKSPGVSTTVEALGWRGYWNHELEQEARENEMYALQYPLAIERQI